jgi:hypothetical protein
MRLSLKRTHPLPPFPRKVMRLLILTNNICGTLGTIFLWFLFNLQVWFGAGRLWTRNGGNNWKNLDLKLLVLF